MATNSYNNAVKISKAALAVIEADATLLKNVRRDDKEFAQDGTAAAGSTRNIRVPGYGKWREGKVAQPSALNDTYIPVTVAQGGADFSISSIEMALDVDRMIDVLRPRIATVVDQLDYELWQLVNQMPLITGTAGTGPTALLSFAQAKAYMSMVGGAPKDGTMSAVLHELSNASLVGGLSTLFNPSQDIATQYKQGNMGFAGGLKFSSDRNAISHVGGVWTGSPVMSGATADAATQFVTTTWGTSPAESILNAGDVYTVDGVYSVSPITKQSTGILKQWCVKTTVQSSSSTMTIVNTETLHSTGPLQNVDAVPLTTARVRPYYASGAVSRESVVLHPDGLVFASAVLPEMGENCVRMKADDLNLSIRLYEYTDGRADEKLWRLDVLRGVALGRPGFAARVAG